jgi:hypothetical protein
MHYLIISLNILITNQINIDKQQNKFFNFYPQILLYYWTLLYYNIINIKNHLNQSSI